MNVSVYLFGEYNSGYTQYPDDYAETIFRKFAANAKSTTQIAIHRDGNLVYYGYIRKLQEKKYIGLCTVLNGLYLKRIDGLFSLFENTISSLAAKGMLIHLNEQGELVTSVERLYLNKEEIELLTETLKAGFNRFEAYSSNLPAVNYSISKDSSKDFVISDDLNEIIKSSFTNGYTYIYKSKGFNTAQINSFTGILAKCNKEKRELQERNEQLQKENAKLRRQKKQIAVVLVLLGILVAVGIWFVSFANDKNQIIRSKSAKIDGLKEHVKGLQADSTTLTITLSETQDLLSQERQKNDTLEKEKAQLSDRVEDLEVTEQSLRNSLSEKDATISSLNRTISSLRNQSRSSSTSSYSSSSSYSNYSSYSYTVGPSTSHQTTGYDNSYALWLYAKKSLKLNSFYVKANKNGYITLALYTSGGYVVASQQVYVYKNQFTKVSTNDSFKLGAGNYYYLAISSSNGISLAYHTSTSSEYNGYKSGNLQITGADQNGKYDTASRNKTSYYQYFYNISYSLKN